MTTLPMAGHPDETAYQRWQRLQHTADVYQAVADDAVAENQRAYERAIDAVKRADHATREAELALSVVLREHA